MAGTSKEGWRRVGEAQWRRLCLRGFLVIERSTGADGAPAFAVRLVATVARDDKRLTSADAELASGVQSMRKAKHLADDWAARMDPPSAAA